MLIAAVCFAYFDVAFLGTMIDFAATQFTLLPAFFVAAIATRIPSAIAGVATDLILAAFRHAPSPSILGNFFWPAVGLPLALIAAKRSIPLPPKIDAPEA